MDRRPVSLNMVFSFAEIARATVCGNLQSSFVSQAPTDTLHAKASLPRDSMAYNPRNACNTPEAHGTEESLALLENGNGSNTLAELLDLHSKASRESKVSASAIRQPRGYNLLPRGYHAFKAFMAASGDKTAQERARQDVGRARDIAKKQLNNSDPVSLPESGLTESAPQVPPLEGLGPTFREMISGHPGLCPMSSQALGGSTLQGSSPPDDPRVDTGGRKKSLDYSIASEDIFDVALQYLTHPDAITHSNNSSIHSDGESPANGFDDVALDEEEPQIFQAKAITIQQTTRRPRCVDCSRKSAESHSRQEPVEKLWELESLPSGSVSEKESEKKSGKEGQMK